MAKQQRGKVCAAMYCDNGSESGKTRLSWPKLKRERQQWTRFVQRRRANFHEPARSNKNCVLCQDHFVESDFENLMEVRMGFQSKLRLKPGAVPTVLSVDDPLRARQEQLLSMSIHPTTACELTSAQRKREAQQVSTDSFCTCTE
jgi:hypothetical protein